VLKYADPNSIESFRCYPRLPVDNFINWNNSVKDVHNLIRAVCYPFSGAYTFHWHSGEVKKLFILKSRIIQFETKDLSITGHVLKNNKETGESFVRCGDGIIALLKCRYEGEQEEFYPGIRWKSIRMRLGVNPNDWLWAIYSKNKKNE
jgi:methionyl-tRNA formyltransferase